MIDWLRRLFTAAPSMSPQRIVLSRRDSRIVADALINPPKLTKGLRKAVRKTLKPDA